VEVVLNNNDESTNQEKNNLKMEEMEEFLKEKERIRQIVGQIGGKPNLVSRITNVFIFVFIIATLVAAPFLPKSFELPAVEVGLALISIKIFFMLQNEAKVTHFQFWMLSSLEWRMNTIAKRLERIDENIEKAVK
jgi:hypothetical protein